MQPESGACAWTISYAPGTQLCASLGTVRSRQGWEVGEQAGPRKQEESGSQEAVRVRSPSRGAHHISGAAAALYWWTSERGASACPRQERRRCLALHAGSHSQRLLSLRRSLSCTGHLSCWVSVRAPQLRRWRSGERHGTAGGRPLAPREKSGVPEKEKGARGSRGGGRGLEFSRRRKGQTSSSPLHALVLVT